MTLPRPDPDRLSGALMEMIAIPSVNPFGGPAGPGRREQEMAEDLRDRMEGLGLETGLWQVAPGRPNLWGRLPGTGGGPAIMLAGHLDTVGVEGCDELLTPTLADGRVHGRGACDMKAAFACFLEVIRIIRTAGLSLPGDVIIAATCDEEDAMIGSKDWPRNGPSADFGIVGEPTGLQVCTAHKGQLCLRFLTRGVATHSSRPERGVNAVEHMARVIAHLSGLDQELIADGPQHPLCGSGRFSMNVIHGGTIASAIPDHCALEIDRRFVPGERPDEIIAGFEARLDGLREAMPDLDVSLSPPTLLVEALDTPPDHPLAAALIRAVEAVTGIPAEPAAFPGGTDAPNMGCPCVVCGPGDLTLAHGRSEHVEIAQMQQACEIYLGAILELNGVAP